MDSQPRFRCELCDFSTIKKCNWTDHIETIKHKRRNSPNDCIQFNRKPSVNYDCKLCELKFYHLSTLTRHKQTKKHKKIEAQNEINIKLLETTKKDAIKNKKKKLIPLTLKRKVWEQQIGEDIGKTKCLCCRLTDITQLSFHCGHIISEANGGEIKLDNLRPICQSCNSSMGTVNMDEFISKYGLTAKEVVV